MKLKTLCILIAFSSALALHIVVVANYIMASFAGYKFTVYTNTAGEHWIELGLLFFSLIVLSLWCPEVILKEVESE